MSGDSAPSAILPDFARANASIVPSLTWRTPSEILPDDVVSATRAVVLVLDSLGWGHLSERREITPTLSAMDGVATTTVAPSTTAAALTSISTGVPPGEHGIVGYRFPVDGGVLNALRWSVSGHDHRSVVAPSQTQLAEPFAGGEWDIVADRQFEHSGFTEAYLGGGHYESFWHPSSLAEDVRRRLADGADRVYAYYDGLDHVAHVHGMHTGHADLELRFCDWLVARLIEVLPTGTALVVTADHGQIDAPDVVEFAPEVLDLVDSRSGEARFRWLHAVPGAVEDLRDRVVEHHGDGSWIWTRDEVIDRGIFGPLVTDVARQRLGDVAVIPHQPFGFRDPGEPHLDRLVGRHGSLTLAEMQVPVLHMVV